MLSKKQLEDAAKCGQNSCGDCKCDGFETGDCVENAAKTALAYREMLKRLEYVKDTGRIGGAIYKFCPNCGVSELNGHTADCELAALLKEVENK